VPKTKKTSRAGVFALVAAVSAAVGGLLGVLFAPQSGKKTRKEIGDFLEKIEKEVVREAKKTANLTEKSYRRIVDQASRRYLKAKKIGVKKMEEIKKELYRRYPSLAKKIKEDKEK